MRVLVVDDVAERGGALYALLSAVQGVEVTGVVDCAPDVRRASGRVTPDLIAISLDMTHSEAIAIAKDVMVNMPTPIVMVSDAETTPSPNLVQSAIAAGALTVLPRPTLRVGVVDPGEMRAFVASLRAFSGVKVVGHRLTARTPSTPAAFAERSGPRVPPQIVAIGASTGGPAALRTLLCALPASFPLPILVVQHLVRGFADEFVRWLDEHIPMRVKSATAGERVVGGVVYVAPEDRHLRVRRGREIDLSDQAAVEGFRPAVSVMFESVARVYGACSMAVVLSGMGRDGVAGLYHLRGAGGQVVVQDEASSVVFGMPGAAIEAGLADQVLSIPAIGRLLGELTRSKR